MGKERRNEERAKEIGEERRKVKRRKDEIVREGR